MKIRLKKLGFTLMEVNLAVFIMAVGVLAMVSLYPLGYRENQQSVDDVKAAAYADAVFNQIAASLSSRTLTWKEWETMVGNAVKVTGADNENEDGSGAWARFCEPARGYVPKKRGEINSLSGQVFRALTGKAQQAGFSASMPSHDHLTVGLVAQWGTADFGKGEYHDDHSRVALSMRVSRNSGALFSQPIFMTEIHFQGDQEDKNVE